MVSAVNCYDFVALAVELPANQKNGGQLGDADGQTWQCYGFAVPIGTNAIRHSMSASRGFHFPIYFRNLASKRQACISKMSDVIYLQLIK
ncbi:hypothetical protein QQP08_016991 [Theobroma cacao]|nr:hypothetical protein QQP08_016991 [Theobroma cacao]